MDWKNPQRICPAPSAMATTYGDAWGWSAFAPVWRLVLACVIGNRAQAGADVLLARVANGTDDTMPLFTSAQWPAYRPALLHTYGAWSPPPRQGCRGASPPPQRRPPPRLRYAQVVKRRTGGRMVEVSPRIVLGTPEAVAARLAHSPVSATSNTRFVERDTLTQRQSHRRLTRRTNGFSKDLSWFEKQRWLALAYDHFVLPHKRLRERFPTPEPTRGVGSPRLWRLVPPAMAAGLTDHVWTTEELLAYRVPVAFLDQLRTIEHLFPAWNGVHHSN